MTRYAEQTTVPVAKTQADLKKVLESYGADEVIVTESRREMKGIVQFRFHELPWRFIVRLPAMTEKRFHERSDGTRRPDGQAQTVWEQACRQQWRVLYFLVKAQLVAIEEGLYKPEEVMLPWLMLQDGLSVLEHVGDKVERYIAKGEHPQLLLGLGDGS